MIPTGNVFLTAGVAHPGMVNQWAAYRAVTRVFGAAPSVIRGLGHVGELDPHKHPVCAAFFHHSKDAPSAVRALSSFVTSGGRLLALHGVSASFKGNEEFEALLGGVFIGHGPVALLKVEGTAVAPLSRGSVRDEPYRHRISGTVTVVATYTLGETSEPCAWYRPYGAGCVGYLSLGHRCAVWRNPAVQELLGHLATGCDERGGR